MTLHKTPFLPCKNGTAYSEAAENGRKNGMSLHFEGGKAFRMGGRGDRLVVKLKSK
jgi:hypothetical protein